MCTSADMELALEDMQLTETEEAELEQKVTDPPDPASNTVRDYILSLWDIIEMSKSVVKWKNLSGKKGYCRTLDDFRSLLMYACEHTSRKKRTPMDTKVMVKKWVSIIRGLATAHDKAPLDQCEFEMDEHLTPLLTAPVKQIRQFYADLVVALKADPTIPFFIWSWFESWGEVILKNAPDGDIKELKTTLATEIATMVEEDVKPDLKKAMIGALQWRSSESLEKIKKAVSSGGKARMVGKESCLFLEVDVDDKTERVML